MERGKTAAPSGMEWNGMDDKVSFARSNFWLALARTRTAMPVERRIPRDGTSTVSSPRRKVGGLAMGDCAGFFVGRVVGCFVGRYVGRLVRGRRDVGRGDEGLFRKMTLVLVKKLISSLSVVCDLSCRLLADANDG